MIVIDIETTGPDLAVDGIIGVGAAVGNASNCELHSWWTYAPPHRRWWRDELQQPHVQARHKKPFREVWDSEIWPLIRNESAHIAFYGANRVIPFIHAELGREEIDPATVLDPTVWIQASDRLFRSFDLTEACEHLQVELPRYHQPAAKVRAEMTWDVIRKMRSMGWFREHDIHTPSGWMATLERQAKARELIAARNAERGAP